MSCGVPDLDVVVEDDPVNVVDDLGFVAELDGLTQASFADRAGIDIVEAHHPARARRDCPPLDAGAGLGDELGRVRSTSTASSSSVDARARVGRRCRRRRLRRASASDGSARSASCPVIIKDFGLTLRRTGDEAGAAPISCWMIPGPATSDP